VIASCSCTAIKVLGRASEATQVEAKVVPASWRGLLQNILVLATALSTAGDSSLRGIAGQLRALGVQLAYRTVNAEALVVPGRSVLIWSVVHRGLPARHFDIRQALRRTAAFGAALLVAVVITVIPVAGMVTVLRALLELTGVADLLALKIAMLLVLPSVAGTGVRAVVAYRVERGRAQRIPFTPGYAVWRLDLLGAPDKGQGFGGQVLAEFLRKASAEQAHVYLLTQPDNVGFYVRHGLTPLVPAYPDGMVLMRRRAGDAAPSASPRVAPGVPSSTPLGRRPGAAASPPPRPPSRPQPRRRQRAD
jgi:hypothetical protein